MKIDFITPRKSTTVSAFKTLEAILVLVVLWGGCLRAENSTPLSEVMRQALFDSFISVGKASSINASRITPADVRAIIHSNLSPDLLDPALRTTGTDYRLMGKGQAVEAHVGILILLYADGETALSMGRKLIDMNGYFNRTKILVRFSYTLIGRRLVVAFTENAGDEEIVGFIDGLSTVFDTGP